MIKVQKDDFDVGQELSTLQRQSATAAIMTYVGLVKDQEESNDIARLLKDFTLDSSEKDVKRVIQQAKTHWNLDLVRVIVRVGKLSLHDRYVFVGVASPSRQEANEACQYIADAIDNLKTHHSTKVKGNNHNHWNNEQTLAAESY